MTRVLGVSKLVSVTQVLAVVATTVSCGGSCYCCCIRHLGLSCSVCPKVTWTRGKGEVKELEGGFGMGTQGCFVRYLRGFVALEVAPWIFPFCR